MELKVSEIESINGFIATVIAAYKDKGKTPDKLFYEIHNEKGDKIGAARKGLTIEGIQKELIDLGEGKYSLEDDQTKIAVVVADVDAKKETKTPKAAKVDSSKNKNTSEANMSEDRGMMDVMKENGKDAFSKVLHGAQVKAANKTVDALLVKLWDKGGRNELLGSVLNDEAGKAAIKIALAFALSTVATEKQFAGAEHVKTVTGLIMEGSGSELVGPLMDLLIPMVSELVSAGKEIGEMKIDSLLAESNKEKEVYDDAAAEEALRKFGKEAKVATVG